MNQTTLKPPVKLRYILAGALAFGFLGGVLWHFLSGEETYSNLSELPVIAPPEGPSKIKPIEPGGAEIAHRDKEVFTVYDPAARTANAAKEPVVVTPEQPVVEGEKTIDVEWKDVSKNPSENASAASESSDTLVLSTKPETKEAEPIKSVQPEAAAPVDTKEVKGESVPVAETVVPAVAAAAIEQTDEVLPKAETTAVPAQPTDPKVTEVKAEAVKVESSKVEQASEKGVGQKYYLQLGAFKTKENANLKIISLKKSNPTAIKNVSFDVRERKGKTNSFYALCTKPLAKDEAKKLFNTLKANKVDCFLVKETK